MVQMRDVTECVLLFRFSLGSQAGRNSALTWCQPLTGKVFIWSTQLVDLVQECFFPVELRG